MDATALRNVFGSDRLSPGVTANAGFRFADAFKPLPPPTGSYPFRLDLKDVLGADENARILAAGRMRLHTVGDTGNSKYGADAQDSVAYHMEQQLAPTETDGCSFFYQLGDVVYFNGERRDYEPQFYEPYLHYTAPIVAIAGNHDAANVAGEYSLQGFVENFCDTQPRHTWMAGESNRTTMVQPNVYWTLTTPVARIIGLYSNVPGQLDKHDTQQQDWLTTELTAARNERCVIITVHHPPYSLDDTHGGYPVIESALNQAYASANRIPDLVLTGHVHNYQRFEKSFNGVVRPLTYAVAGAGGYAGYTALHKLKALNHPDPNVTLVAHNTDLPGFLRLTIDHDAITGEYFTVPRPPYHKDPGHPATLFETFRIPLGAGA